MNVFIILPKILLADPKTFEEFSVSTLNID